ncbi:hypothetical protein NFJ02_07g132880 [Pycnococcus provasolii]
MIHEPRARPVTIRHMIRTLEHLVFQPRPRSCVFYSSNATRRSLPFGNVTLNVRITAPESFSEALVDSINTGNVLGGFDNRISSTLAEMGLTGLQAIIGKGAAIDKRWTFPRLDPRST